MKQEAVIFDLFGVVFYLRIKPIVQSIGLGKLLIYLLMRRKNPVNLFFNILDSMRCTVPGEYQQLVTYHNTLLPQSICEWQRGMITSDEVLHRIEQYIDLLDTQGFFADEREKELVIASAHASFDPKYLLRACEPNRSVVSVIEWLKEKNYPVYALSNVNQELYQALYSRYKELFEQFEGVVVSYQCKLVKPEPQIFTYLCDEYNLTPQQCYFIDDQRENVHAAQSVGMRGIMYKKGDSLLHELQNYL